MKIHVVMNTFSKSPIDSIYKNRNNGCKRLSCPCEIQSDDLYMLEVEIDDDVIAAEDPFSDDRINEQGFLFDPPLISEKLTTEIQNKIN
jgi:hypothetical protein